MACVYFENNDLSIHEPCIGYIIFGNKFVSLLVVFLTGFSLANIPALLQRLNIDSDMSSEIMVYCFLVEYILSIFVIF